MDDQKHEEIVRDSYQKLWNTYTVKKRNLLNQVRRSAILHLPESGNVLNLSNGCCIAYDPDEDKLLFTNNSKVFSHSFISDLASDDELGTLLRLREIALDLYCILDDDVMDQARDIWRDFYYDLRENIMKCTYTVGDCYWYPEHFDSKRSRRKIKGIIEKEEDHEYGINLSAIFCISGNLENNINIKARNWDFMSILGYIKENLDYKNTLSID